jgi:predicted ArsR family transcriptional regulator
MTLMDEGVAEGAAIEALALLGDQNRRRLYEHVVANQRPVGRDEAASSVGISRELAAFHLDRLVAAGLLETEYRRLSGRTGPGAGRPAKLYRRARREIAVSLPRRDYAAAAAMFAGALSRLEGMSVETAVAEVAHGAGTDIGVQARREAGPRPSHRRLKAALLGRLRSVGFEPEVDPETGEVRLCNCPYAALSASQRDLTCGMNMAWAQGLVDGLADPKLEPELAPAPGRCCVVFHEADGARRAGRDE